MYRPRLSGRFAEKKKKGGGRLLFFLPGMKSLYLIVQPLYRAYAIAILTKIHSSSVSILYRVRQKYLTILQNSCEWNRWRGEFVLERSSSETQSISICHRALVCRASGFCCGDVFQKQRFCLDSENISSAIQYSSERVSIVAIRLPLRISQEQGVRKETKDNGGFEKEHEGRSGSNFTQHAATNDAGLPETLDNKGRHLTDTIFRK